MMICVLKKSHGHPFFRVTNNMGQKFDTLQGVGTSTTQKQLLTSEVPEALSPLPLCLIDHVKGTTLIL